MIHYQRSGRGIARNHSNAIPRYIISYRVLSESKTGGSGHATYSHNFKAGIAIATRIVGRKPCGTSTRRIGCPGDFWEFVRTCTSNNFTTWIISQNALFDMVLSGMPQEFEESRLVVEWPRSNRKREDNKVDNVHARALCIIESPPTIIAAKVVASQGRVVIVDTLNWFSQTVEKLADTIGTKLPDPVTQDSDTESIYCRLTAECQTIMDTFVNLIQWVKEFDGGMFRYTAPSQAMSAYRHRFMEKQIYVHDSPEAKDLERKAYFGGRSEVFKLGKINRIVHQIDVNALFPSVMQNGYFPNMLDRYEIRPDYSAEMPEIEWINSVAEVQLCTKEATFPVRTEKSVLYPIGTFATALCGLELDYAKRKGYIVAVRSWSTYRTAKLFNKWVTELWQLRQEYREAGNKLYAEFTKRLMNSLYGKFGQMSPKWENVQDDCTNLPWSRWAVKDTQSGESQQYRSFGWQVQKQAAKGEIDGTFVAISAFVTSAARMRMNALRAIAGSENVYYQGIDGLIVLPLGLERLRQAGEVSESELGKLRLQLTCNTGEIIGCSDYRLDDKEVISGRSFNHEITEQGECMQRKFSATNFLFSGKAIDTVSESETPWKRVQTYSKGIGGQNGWVSPIQLGIG